MVASAPTPRGDRTQSPHLSKRDLSPRRAALLELLQSINFGRIEKLAIHAGEPVVDPRPVIVREHKFGGENGPRAELGAANFELKQQVVELFDYFDDLGDAVIEWLEVKHGLPFRLSVREVPA